MKFFRGYKKYLQVFKITIREYLVYRLNFLLWRFRAVVGILVLYFLWQTAIPHGTTLFGYDQAKILTYILGTSIIRSIVLSSRSLDVAGQIASGDLVNFLIKPISYIRYWFSKDLADKFLNITFSFFEIIVLIFLLKPPFIIQTDIGLLALTTVAVLIGMILYFYISFFLSLIAFWSPENPWPVRFLFDILVGFFAGGLFPLDILPKAIFDIFKILPFGYLLFFPLEIYLGNIDFSNIATGMIISLLWLFVISQLTRLMFQKGLRDYSAWGR
ncbi:MAG: ABC-2 family transporter protein [bacterium]|nr:ABC-2 family transporter protein [bacterium]